MKKDLAYYFACNDAREDAWYRGIRRTDAEVEKEAARYRALEKKSK